VCHQALTTVHTTADGFTKQIAALQRGRERERRTLRAINAGLRREAQAARAAAQAEAHDAIQQHIEKTAAAEALVKESRDRYLALEGEWKSTCVRLAQREAKLSVQTRAAQEVEERLVQADARLQEMEREKVAAERRIADTLKRLEAHQAEAAERLAEETMARYRLEETVAGLQESLRLAKTEAHGAQAERDAVNVSLARCKERLAEKEKEAAQLFGSNGELRIRVEEERRNFLEATAQVRAFQNSLKDMEQRTASEADSFQKALEHARSDIGKSTTERNQALHAVDLSAKVIRDFQDRIASLKERAEQAERRTEQEQGRVTAGVRRLEASEAEAEALRAEVERLRAECRDKTAAAQAAEDRAAAHREETRALEQRLQDELKRWREMFEEEVVKSTLALEEERSLRQAGSKDLEGRAAALDARVEELAAELSAEKERAAELEVTSTGLATEVMELEVDFARVSDELKAAKALLTEQQGEIERFIDQSTLLHRAVEAERSRATQEHTRCEAAEAALQAHLSAGKALAMREDNDALATLVAAPSHTEQLAVAALGRERALRRAYYNRLVELQGNIRVHARARPEAPGAQPAAEICDDGESVIVAGKQFSFDRSYPTSATQEAVYADVEPLVRSVVDGFNACVMAYGQTGSGKTYTMQGTDEHPGVIPRAVNTLFGVLAEGAAGGVSAEVRMSMLEIYQNEVYDLLAQGQPKREVVETPEGTVVQGSAKETVTGADQMMRIFARGARNRAEGSTLMNEHSSRSHSVVILSVATRDAVTGVETHSQLTLVDLAGSESVDKSGASGDALQEAKAINKSLCALGDVLGAISERRPHIPYRNSKLTTILRDTLGGDSKMMMIVCFVGTEDHLVETKQALSFGLRAMQTELGQATRQIKGSSATATSAPQTPGRTPRASTGGSATPANSYAQAIASATSLTSTTTTTSSSSSVTNTQRSRKARRWN
jgi:kinesin family protein C2/C3